MKKKPTLHDLVEAAHDAGMTVTPHLVPNDDTLLNILHACQNGKLTCRKAAQRIEHLFARRDQEQPKGRFRLNEAIRHKLTGEICRITSVDGEIARAEPTTSCYFLQPPYEGWERVT